MSFINPRIFRAYDIRGIAGTDLTAETAYLIGKGTATHLKRNYNVKNMAVGRDARLSGPELEDAFIKGVTECGIDTTKIGLSISSLIYWATCAMPFDSATNITASHNPKDYNGFKTVAQNSHAICGDELQEVLKLIENSDFDIAENPGKISEQSLTDEYLKDLETRAKLSKPLKVVIDAGNGVAGIFAPQLLRKLGCEVIELFCEPDGNFPNHEANPEELHNMRDLIKKIIETHADLGIGFDGDGDRIGVIDEKGHHYSSDFLLLLLTKELVKRVQNPSVVFDVKVSQVIINKMKELGANPVMCRVGHSFIEKKMKEVSAPLAGEVSGHMFFAEDYYGFDDALLAAIKILEVLSKETKPFSELFDDLPKTVMTPEFKLPCPDDRKFEIVKELVEHFTNLYECITIDGVRILFDEISWGAVRASNTSPNLTLRFEATTKEKLKEIMNIMIEQLQKYPEVDYLDLKIKESEGL